MDLQAIELRMASYAGEVERKKTVDDLRRIRDLRDAVNKAKKSQNLADSMTSLDKALKLIDILEGEK